MRWIKTILTLSLLTLHTTLGAHAAAVVFSSDFETGMPAELSAPGTSIVGVQGFADLGSADNKFAGSFLQYTGVSNPEVTLTLSDLPAHERLSVGFLLGVIDSWDGTELIEVRVDGVLIFSHWFQLATGDESSYDAPAGSLLSSGVNLGFLSGFYYDRDRAYDMSADPAFTGIPHTSGGVTITWSVGGSGWQGGPDETWALDNVIVELDATVAASTSSWSTFKSRYSLR